MKQLSSGGKRLFAWTLAVLSEVAVGAAVGQAVGPILAGSISDTVGVTAGQSLVLGDNPHMQAP